MKFNIRDILEMYEEIQDSIVFTKHDDTYHKRIFKVDDKFYEANYVLNYNSGLLDKGDMKCREVWPQVVPQTVYVYGPQPSEIEAIYDTSKKKKL